MPALYRLCSSVAVSGAFAFAMLTWAGHSQAAAISGQGDWEITLQPRYFTSNHSNGPDAYYDAALNVTWLGNTVYPFSDPGSAGMRWSTAQQWTTTLNVAGVTGWRLPSASANEFASLYALRLGNNAAKIQGGQMALNTGPFKNLLTVDNYWMNESTPPQDGFQSAWQFDFSSGQQHLGLTSMDGAAWFVHTGDVFLANSVPEPSTAYLVLVGLALAASSKLSKGRQAKAAS
jgi:hypothetical protein